MAPKSKKALSKGRMTTLLVVVALLIKLFAPTLARTRVLECRGAAA